MESNDRDRRVPQISRRHLIQTGSALFVMTGIVGRAGRTVANSAPVTTPGDEMALEAPMLAERVRAGQLPPLAERLPVTPLVVQPYESPGVYGGEWHTAIRGPADTAWLYRTINYDQLTRWGWQIDATDTVDNLAEAIEPNSDGTVYTIHLREGVKWSDGAPFTTDDILFAYYDVLSNPALFPTVPTWISPAGKPAEMEAIDEKTLRVTFAAPLGLLRGYLGLAEGLPLTLQPKHYLQEYHIDYNPQADEFARGEGYPGWSDLFAAKGITTYPGEFQNADLPTVTPWHLLQTFGEGTRLVAERNPYYWKTDPEGRQLPYIDTVIFDVIEDVETMLLKATNGEFDFHTRHFVELGNKPVLAEARESGNFDFIDIVPSGANELVISLNLVHPDPVKREIFNNKDFRIGLSHAIDRAQIIEASFEGQGEPWQMAPRPEGPFYDEEMAKQYIEYDPDLANEILDNAGYSTRDSDGFRLGPDDSRIAFDINIDAGSADAGPLERVKQNWADVGVELRIQSMDRALFFERVNAVEFDAVSWYGDAGLYDAIFFPRYWFPSEEFSFFAVPWANWYKGLEPSEEPPEAVQRQMELFDMVKASTDNAERIELFRELISIAKDQFYSIGTVLPASGYGIKKNNFHNVPTPMNGSSPFPYPATGDPEQFYISDAE